MPEEKVWGQVVMEHLPGGGWGGTQGLVPTQRARKEASRAETWRLGKDAVLQPCWQPLSIPAQTTWAEVLLR